MSSTKLSTQYNFTLDSTTTPGTHILIGVGSEGSTWYANETLMNNALNASSGFHVAADDTLTVSFGAAGGTEIMPGYPVFVKVALPLFAGKQKFALMAATPGTTGPYSRVIPGLNAFMTGLGNGAGFDLDLILGHSASGNQGMGEADVGTPEAGGTGLASANPTDDNSGAAV